jgi:hypothetical protein
MQRITHCAQLAEDFIDWIRDRSRTTPRKEKRYWILVRVVCKG